MAADWVAFARFCLLVAAFHVCYASGVESLKPQTNTWNSSFTLSKAQIAAANLSAAVANNVEVALNFERSNNAGNLIQNDPFYQLPDGLDLSKLPKPGTVLKVEAFTNTSFYTIPPSISMSRFLYVTETLNGSSAPASALVLWPYVPRHFQSLKPSSAKPLNGQAVYPVVAWAHGTSGQTQACAPSGLRDLWDEFHLPYPLALAGYAVVAPDYLGLGIANTTSPYFIFPSQANDVFHAIAAAQTHWPAQLSKQFVIAGQSQGGGVAWSCAQRQAKRPVDGYLGTFAASPFTDVLNIIAADKLAQNNARVAGIAQGLDSVYPGSQLTDWLTDAGIARLRLLQQIKGCGLVGAQLLGDPDSTMLQDDWNTTSSAEWYRNVSTNGGKQFAGPMLVTQGTEDPNANEPVNTKMVNETCTRFPQSQLQYIRYEGITHVPVLYAGQYLYLDWIRDRFAGVKVMQGCTQETLRPVRGMQSIGDDQNWFLEYDLYGL